MNRRRRYPAALDKGAPVRTQSETIAAQRLPQPSSAAASIIDTQRKARHVGTLRAEWSPANCAFLVMFGDARCGIGTDNRAIFNTREELRSAVTACGLVLLDSGAIVMPEDA